eukprot:4505512-Prymnesium_polylepis.1
MCAEATGGNHRKVERRRSTMRIGALSGEGVCRTPQCARPRAAALSAHHSQTQRGRMAVRAHAAPASLRAGAPTAPLSSAAGRALPSQALRRHAQRGRAQAPPATTGTMRRWHRSKSCMSAADLPAASKVDLHLAPCRLGRSFALEKHPARSRARFSDYF